MKLLASVAAFGAVALSASAASTPVVGDNPCTQGPSFWCASAANAEKCNFKTADCKKYCDDKKEYPDLANSEVCNPPGSNPCTWGPSYWCASKANAKKCDFKPAECAKYCNNTKEYPELAKSDICLDKPAKPDMVGTNPCTYGPSFWCASFANALKCQFNVTECGTYCANATEYADIQSGNICNATALNLTDCMAGAAYSCASMENADKCGVNATDCKPYCKNKDFPKLKDSEVCKKTKPEPADGSDKCTQGPSFFCATRKSAKACGIKNAEKECRRYCNATEYPELAKNGAFCKHSDPAAGSDKCTQGPSFFCTSRENAKACKIKNAAKECSKYCNKEYPEVQKGDFCGTTEPVVGSNKCTQGPSYFCASSDNAKACNIENAAKECSKYCNNEYPDVQKGAFCS